MNVTRNSDGSFEMSATWDELSMIVAALNETANGIYTDEIPVRTGFSRDEFLELLDCLLDGYLSGKTSAE